MKPIQSIFFSEKINLIKTGLLQENIALELFNHWEKLISEYANTTPCSSINYCILLLLVRTNLLYFQVHEPREKKIIYEFGLKNILPFPADRLSDIEDFPDMIEYRGQKIGTWFRKYSRPNFYYNIFAFFPENYDISLKIIQLKNLLIYYHSTSQRQKLMSVRNLFQKKNETIVNNLKQLLQTKKKVNVVHLQVESLDAYLEVGRNILVENIKNVIIETVQNHYIVYTLNPNEYLVIIVDAERPTLEKILKRMVFRYGELTIEHQVTFLNIEKEISCTSELWE